MLALLLMLLVPQDAPGLPEIKIRQIGDDDYLLTTPDFKADELKALEAESAVRASALCKEKRLVWGDSSFGRSARGNGIIVDYRREFHCSVDDLVKFPPAPSDWRATGADTADATEVFTGFFAEIDAGRMEAAYARFEPGVIPNGKEWAEGTRQLVSRLGPGTRRVTRVRWMVNPPGGAHPGVFAIVLFEGDYGSTHYYCGMLAMYRPAPGKYQIVREDRSVYFERGENLSPDQIETLRARECPR